MGRAPDLRRRAYRSGRVARPDREDVREGGARVRGVFQGVLRWWAGGAKPYRPKRPVELGGGGRGASAGKTDEDARAAFGRGEGAHFGVAAVRAAPGEPFAILRAGRSGRDAGRSKRGPVRLGAA